MCHFVNKKILSQIAILPCCIQVGYVPVEYSTVHFLELVLKFSFVVAIILFLSKNIWTFNFNYCGFWMSLTACTVHLLVRFSSVIYGISCNLGYTNKITDHTLYNNTFIPVWFENH